MSLKIEDFDASKERPLAFGGFGMSIQNKRGFHWLWFIGPIGMTWFAVRSWLNYPDQNASTLYLVQCILATFIAVAVLLGVTHALYKPDLEKSTDENSDSVP